VRRYANRSPSEAELAFDAPPVKSNSEWDQGHSPLFSSADFGPVLTAMIRIARKGGPVRFETIMVLADGPDMGGGMDLTLGGKEIHAAWQWPREAELPAGVFPIIRTRSIPGPVVHALAELASDKVSGLADHHRDVADEIAAKETAR
jgi:hypothetical protein